MKNTNKLVGAGYKNNRRETEAGEARIKDLEAKLVDMNLGRQELEKQLSAARSEKELLLLDLTKAREKNSSSEERHKEELEKKEEELREILEKQKKYIV